MAFGIFALAALPALPEGVALRAPFALCLVVAWAILVAAHLRHCRSLLRRAQGPIDRFALGTWIAGSAVVAKLALQAMPAARPLAEILGAVALLLWLGLSPFFTTAAWRLARQPPKRPLPGAILLSTVSTQSLALLALDLLPVGIGRPIGVGLLLIGGIFYVGCAALILRSLIWPWRLVVDWSNTHCILHGALSISGYAMALSGAAGPTVLSVLWIVTALVFIAVEAVEIARLISRVLAFGWQRGAFAYDVSQWARNFTFGMFYAFTGAVGAAASGTLASNGLTAVQNAVLQTGSYVVLALLLLEVAIYFLDKAQFRRAR